MGGKVIETEASKIRKERDSEHARAMLEDGLNPERVARILRISERELYELTKAKHVQTT